MTESSSWVTEDRKTLTAVLDVIRALGGTIGNIKRYPRGSAIIKMTVDRSLNNFREAFKTLDGFTISEDEKAFCINDVVLPEKYQRMDPIQNFVFCLADRKIKSLTFSKLIPSDSKEDKVYTFIPLLHLENQRKIDMKQFRHFGEINIEMLMQKNLHMLPMIY